MNEPSSPNEHDRGPHRAAPPAPRFRLVEEEDSRPTGPAKGRAWSAVSRRLLIDGDDWRSHWPNDLEGLTRVRAYIPLISSIARIRSDADAALALTAVIEALFRGEGVQLPCGALSETELGLVVPEGADLDAIATTIDESIAGQVRATDLQGPLRDRSRARVDPF